MVSIDSHFWVVFVMAKLITTLSVSFFHIPTINWCLFYEARFGIEIFIELYNSTLLSSVSPTCWKDTLPPTS